MCEVLIAIIKYQYALIFHGNGHLVYVDINLMIIKLVKKKILEYYLHEKFIISISGRSLRHH